MTTTETRDLTAELSAKADRYLWGHFARHGHGISAPIISRGEGCYVYDSHGKRYFDGLSGLFVV
ncbi:MAG: aspartate aminotransferase family protein, partial [Mycobacterium sp.]